jgi:hypothetical protein
MLSVLKGLDTALTVCREGLGASLCNMALKGERAALPGLCLHLQTEGSMFSFALQRCLEHSLLSPQPLVVTMAMSFLPLPPFRARVGESGQRLNCYSLTGPTHSEPRLTVCHGVGSMEHTYARHLLVLSENLPGNLRDSQQHGTQGKGAKSLEDSTALGSPVTSHQFKAGKQFPPTPRTVTLGSKATLAGLRLGLCSAFSPSLFTLSDPNRDDLANFTFPFFLLFSGVCGVPLCVPVCTHLL